MDGALSGSDHDDETFAALSAAGATVDDVRFAGCRFVECDLSEAVLRSCDFDDCVFTGCSLSVARVPLSRFCDVTFSGCKMTGVDFAEADWSARAAAAPLRFDGCGLDLAVFLGLALRAVVFRDCSLRDADFSDADLTEADFAGSDLTGARFSRTTLTAARLEAARGYDIDLRHNDVRRMVVSLPEAASLLGSLGVELVEPPG